MLHALRMRVECGYFIAFLLVFTALHPGNLVLRGVMCVGVDVG